MIVELAGLVSIEDPFGRSLPGLLITRFIPLEVGLCHPAGGIFGNFGSEGSM